MTKATHLYLAWSVVFGCHVAAAQTPQLDQMPQLVQPFGLPVLPPYQEPLVKPTGCEARAISPNPPQFTPSRPHEQEPQREFASSQVQFKFLGLGAQVNPAYMLMVGSAQVEGFLPLKDIRKQWKNAHGFLVTNTISRHHPLLVTRVFYRDCPISLEPGDEITSIDGQQTKGMRRTVALMKIRGGLLGSSITLGILRNGQNMTLNLHRVEVTQNGMTAGCPVDSPDTLPTEGWEPDLRNWKQTTFPLGACYF